jgi:hypothetical protein
MNGPHRCLVTPSSATSCLPPGIRSSRSAELPRTHSELVKFSCHDPEYDKVSDILCRMYQGRIITPSTTRGMYVEIGGDRSRLLKQSSFPTKTPLCCTARDGTYLHRAGRAVRGDRAEDKDTAQERKRPLCSCPSWIRWGRQIPAGASLRREAQTSIQPHPLDRRDRPRGSAI